MDQHTYKPTDEGSVDPDELEVPAHLQLEATTGLVGVPSIDSGFD